MYVCGVHTACLYCLYVGVDLLLAAAAADGFPRFGSAFKQDRYYENYGFSGKFPFKRSVRSQGEITYSTLSSYEARENGTVTAKDILEFLDQIKSGVDLCGKENKVDLVKHYQFSTEYFFRTFKVQIRKAVDLANTLNDNFLYKDEDDLHNDVIYFALTQSIVETEHTIIGCGIAFGLGQYPSKNQRGAFFPYSYRAGKSFDTTVVSDISYFYAYTNASWFLAHSFKPGTQFLQNREFVFARNSDVGNYNDYVYRQNLSIFVSERDGFWGQPYYDCKLKKLIIQYSVPFYQMRTPAPKFKGVVLIDIDFERLEINQCINDGSPFNVPHRCRPETTSCFNIPGKGFSLGSYQCKCSPGFYFKPTENSDKYFDGKTVERAYLDMVQNISDNYSTSYQCVPCRKGCEACEGDNPCIVEYDVLMRGIPLGIQSFCMTITLVLGIVIVRLRKTKVMRSSMWILLEMVLVGALFLYATVVIQYFEPTTITCLLVPWLREVGFAIVYGALVLKIYRILAEFQSRKAHRVHVRDKDLLKYLTVIIIVVIGYMAAWTAVNMDHLSEGASLVDMGTTLDNLKYIRCKSYWWDYVIELSEFLFLCVVVYLCYCVRSAPSEYSEGKYISAAICYETIVSTIFYILKHLKWFSFHPDYLFLMYFLRCQLTVTVILLLILGPKLWYAHRPLEDEHMRSRAYSQSDVQDSIAPETMKLNVGISSNGDVDVGEISLAEMDPEDIRAELKRLYTQLQIYKTKTMRKDNPHISKRRGGRKQTHRRFSLQAFHHKHRHHHDHEHEHEMSKTPEESTNSAEAMAMCLEGSSRDDTHEARSGPSVSFKTGHK